MLENLPAMCDLPTPTWWIFSSNVPSLIYYSHLPIILIALALGFFVYKKGKTILPNKILFITIITFALWVFLDSIFWASNRSDVIMFIWSLQIIFEPLIYIGMLYLLYTVIDKKDMPFYQKLVAILMFLPILVLTPTKYILSGFDAGICLSKETLFSYYTYVIEAIYIFWIIFYTGNRYRKSKVPAEKKQILLLTSGSILFLLAFSSGNIIGSLTEDWNTAQIGLFGMPIFIGFLAYTIVKFKTFNIKLIGTQVLVISLWCSLFALLFITSLENIRLIIGLTLIFFTFVGYALLKSVRKERNQLEKIAELAKDLEKSNKRLKELDLQKSEFVSIASHQLRGPLTAIKGYTSLILEGDMGNVPPEARDAADKIFKSAQSLVSIVNDFLDVSRIEQGRMKYDFSTFDMKELIQSTVDEFKPVIADKGLSISFSNEAGETYMVNGDRNKLKQVINNLLDNSIKYTPVGSIKLCMSKDEDNVITTVIDDTGVGMSEGTIEHLFEKFSRAENASATNVIGTGLGLYVAKEMIKAHHGRIWAESDGEGKGSQFYIELQGI